ncbi:hypothetical protein IMZ48_47495, partial [Candidatus Bathyarchaeota archaeon]|nr:hypothetical protein [Candidatus Bathyarchaeota archaeon]
MTTKEERIFCSDGRVCGKKNSAFKQHVPPGQQFTCLDCLKARGGYGIDIMDFLSKKMSDIKKAKGDEYRFAIRELVQNADDANAKMVVVRLDPDAICVANDGYAFRPPSGKFEGDYFRICRVLSKPKAKEAESTGAHGSGFQTVYCFTNHPELHSAGIS